MAVQITPRQGFFITLPILHGLSAIAALVICFYCDVGQMSHQARVPKAPRSIDVGAPFNNSAVKLYASAFRWAEDAEFVTHTWNPFALTMVFQWLTAGFALRNIAPLINDGVTAAIWDTWLLAGYACFLTWSIVQPGAWCVAMFATVTASFVASAVICYMALGPPSLYTQPRPLPNERKWIVPNSVRELKQQPPSEDVDTEMVVGVLIRYAEYCVTAPLLFLAVVCLLIVDAPAWLFLTGYWLVLACNLFGIPLHYNFLVAMNRNIPKGGWTTWLARLLLSPPWGDADSAVWYNLQAAWISLMIPVSGLVYLSRRFLLDPDMPVIALFMVWNLLITYLMFGVIPTVVYLTKRGIRTLPWLLDILNICAKFPLPIVIIVGFITRPVTFRPCIS